MSRRKPCRLSQYTAENGLRATARLFGRSTQWVLDRYHYKAHFRPDGSLDRIEGPAEPEIVRVQYASK